MLVGLAVMILLAAAWAISWNAFKSSSKEPVRFSQLPGMSGEPEFAMLQLVRLRAGEEPLILATVTSEEDPTLISRLTEALDSRGYLKKTSETLSPDMIRAQFVFEGEKAAALEIHSDSAVTLVTPDGTEDYAALNREEDEINLFTLLYRLFDPSQTPEDIDG